MTTWKSTFLFLPILLILGSLNYGHLKAQTDTSLNLTPLQTACITKIIAADDSLGTIRNQACRTLSLSETITQYVEAVHQLDYTDCPEGFKRAFNNHLKAWSEMKAVTNKFPDLRGEMHELLDIIAASEHGEEYDALLKPIWSTWSEVERYLPQNGSK